TMFVYNTSFVARHEFTRAARTHIARTIADKDMENLRATDAIQNLDVKLLLPTTEDIGWQRLTRRDAGAHRRKIKALLGVGNGKHTGIKCRDSEEDSWMILIDNLKHLFSNGTLRIENNARTDAEGEIEAIAQTI